LSPTKGSNKIRTSPDLIWWLVGTSLAGYNTARHSGALWDDWVDQWENVVNSTRDQDWFKVWETPNGTAPTGDYSLTFRVQYLVAD
jgi:hypothetical protein